MVASKKTRKVNKYFRITENVNTRANAFNIKVCETQDNPFISSIKIVIAYNILQIVAREVWRMK